MNTADISFRQSCERGDQHLQDYNLSNYDVKIMFSVIFSVLLKLVFFNTFTLKVSVIQFQEIITCISLRQMDNFRFGGKYSQSTIEQFPYGHSMVKPWFNHELAMV